jgi:hypothetical protein
MRISAAVDKTTRKILEINDLLVRPVMDCDQHSFLKKGVSE